MKASSAPATDDFDWGDVTTWVYVCFLAGIVAVGGLAWASRSEFVPRIETCVAT